MRRLIAVLLIALPMVLAADESKPLPRESQLEFEVLAQRERDVNERMDALYKLLITPLQLAKSEAVKHACELVGIKPIGADGKPACEVRDGKVVALPLSAPTGLTLPLASPAPKEEKAK